MVHLKTLTLAVLAACMAAPAARATDAMSLNNLSPAAWTLIIPPVGVREVSRGSLEVEKGGKLVKTLARAGDSLVLPAGFKGLLVFRRTEAGEFSLRFNLVDRNRQYQQFSAYLDPNFNRTPHVTLGANSVLNLFAPTFLADLAAVMDFGLDQYYLTLHGEALPPKR